MASIVLLGQSLISLVGCLASVARTEVKLTDAHAIGLLIAIQLVFKLIPSVLFMVLLLVQTDPDMARILMFLQLTWFIISVVTYIAASFLRFAVEYKLSVTRGERRQ